MLIQFKRFQSKLILFLGFSLVITIAGCGGGDSDPADAADPYVGTWKSSCYLYSAGVYTQRIRVISKQSATQLVSNNPNTNAYSDANCSVLVSASSLTHLSGTFNLGSKATFLGQSVDTYTFVPFTGSANSTGYMTANAVNLYIAFTYDAVVPTAWAVDAAPSTKQ